MKLSIIIPTYNSNGRVLEVIKAIQNLKLQKIQKEIIVVDDASTDKTFTSLKKIHGIILIHHRKNTGKGGSVNDGFTKATGDILMIQDDDMEYDPKEIPKIISPILQNEAQIVFGSRRLNKRNTYSSPLYYFGGVLVDTLVSFVLSTKLTDAITGAKIMTREVYNAIKPIVSEGFEIEAEIAVKAVKHGYKPLEVPIHYSPRSHKEGKNIRWHHSFAIVKSLIYHTYFS